MSRYVVTRVIHAIIILWAVATTVFFGLRAIPGDPVDLALGIHASEESVQQVRHQLGLDQPLHIQYIDWMMGLLQLDFGRSISSGQEVSVLLARSIPKTFSIGALAILIGLAVAIPTGVISATRKNQPADYIATVAAFSGISMPAFFVGILLAVVFGSWLNILPIFGYTPIRKGIIPWLQSIILPAIAIGLPYAAIVMRMMRSSLIEIMGTDYMETARAKGVPPRVRLFKHAMQNALIPVVTVAGIQIALILVGSVTVEIVFGINGLGRLVVDAMLNHDYPVVQSVIIVIASIMVFMNLLVDILYTIIDPRIRYGAEET